MGVPYTFASATNSIPLSQLDANFNTPVTIGSTTVGLGNTVSTLTNVTLSNATITSVSTPITVPQGGTGLTSLTAGYIPYGNGTSAFSSSSSLYFDGTNLGIGTSSPAAAFETQKAGNYLGTFRYSSTTPTLAYINVVNANNSTLGAVIAHNADGTVFMGNQANYATLFATNNTERMRIDSSGRLLLGTTSALSNSLATFGNNTGSPVGWGFATLQNSGGITPPTSAGLSIGWNFSNGGGENNIVYGTSAGATPALAFSSYNGTTTAERMRIDSSGNFFVNATAQSGDRPNNTGIQVLPVGDIKIRVATDSQPALQFYSPTGGGTPVGSVNAGASATSYNTSSDYRLKDNVAPMTGALNIVSKLKPVTYTWKADGSDGQGFIAHELQSVVPDCVTGEKDAVDAEGKPVYQGIDTSFLVATLTAAIQELNAKFEEYKASHP